MPDDDHDQPRPRLPADLTKTAILLDVDGTILDLAPTPREVFVPHSLRETLDRLLKRTGGGVAFVSGRPDQRARSHLSPLQLPAIGGHGAEMRIVAGTMPEPPRLPPLDAKLKRKFAAIAEAGPGIILEDKGYSLALHYRLAPDKERLVREAAAKICADVGGASIEFLPGKLVVEIKQTWDHQGDGCTRTDDICAICTAAGRSFIGDDVTDLSVFAIMPELEGSASAVGPQASWRGLLLRAASGCPPLARRLS